MDRFSSFRQIASLDITLADLLTADRLDRYWLTAGPLRYWYGTALVTDAVLAQFQTFSDHHHLLSTFNSLFGENKLNPTEDRSVTHIRLRQESNRSWLNSINEFCHKIHTEAHYTTVIQIGIGGSELGPRAAYHALKRWAKVNKTLRMKAKFIANLDSDDARYTIEKLDLTRALIVVVSKSGGTLETQANLQLVMALAAAQGISESQFKNQLFVVTTQGSSLDVSGQFGYSFYLDEGVGGRFSVTSPAGLVALSLCFGPEVVCDFLNGAIAMDSASQISDIQFNLPLLSAFLGVWDRTILGFSARAVIPYCEGLRFLPHHLQQLECESCGKRVSADGQPLEFSTSPAVFGHTGTQAQHSFFQNFHQGTNPVPVEFVGILQGQLDGTVHQDVLASLVGQIAALALGRTHDDLRKHCPGNRPSTLVLADELTPYSLGALLAYYENRTIFQGLIWGINPFDQEGVELGKLLYRQVLAGDTGFPAALFSKILR